MYTQHFTPFHEFLYRVSFPEGKQEVLWPGVFPVEVPGRNLLLCSKVSERGIFERSLSGDAVQNPETRLLDDFLPMKGGFQPFAEGVYYVSYTSRGNPRAFCFRSFDSGRTTEITPVPLNYSGDVSVSPDRSRLAYTSSVAPNVDLIEIDLADR